MIINNNLDKNNFDTEGLNIALAEILNNSVTKAVMDKDHVSSDEIISLLKTVKTNRAAFKLAA